MTFLSVLYVIPCIFQGFYWWGMFVFDVGALWFCACFPFVIVSFVLVPVVVVLACSGVAVYGIFCGPRAAVEAYNNGVGPAFEKMLNWIVEVNSMYLKYLRMRDK